MLTFTLNSICAMDTGQYIYIYPTVIVISLYFFVHIVISLYFLYTYCNQVVLFYIHIVISLYFLYKLKCTYICTLNYSIPVVTYIRKYTVGVSIWNAFNQLFPYFYNILMNRNKKLGPTNQRHHIQCVQKTHCTFENTV